MEVFAENDYFCLHHRLTQFKLQQLWQKKTKYNRM